MKTISVADLRTRGACAPQIALFAETFGEGDVPITEANVLAALRKGLDVTWLLPTPARRAYNEAIAPAWRAYDEAIAPARRAYNEAIASAWRAYDEAIASARRAYNEAIASARRAYDEAVSPILARFLAGV